MKNKSIVIICGDPKSIFNEILIKTLKDKSLKEFKLPIKIVCSEELFKYELKKFKTKLNFQNLNNKRSLEKRINIINIPLDYKNLSVSKVNSYIRKSFETGLNLIKENNSLALINGPISKTSFLKGKYNGITEFIIAPLLP